ncbi:hypothetical protein Tco_0432016 [Tanacetum coccineum]
MLARAERAEEEEGHSSAQNMAGYKIEDFKRKSFDAIKEMFDKDYKQVNTCVPMDSEGVQDSRVKVAGSEKAPESSKKRTRAELGEESVNR